MLVVKFGKANGGIPDLTWPKIIYSILIKHHYNSYLSHMITYSIIFIGFFFLIFSLKNKGNSRQWLIFNISLRNSLCCARVGLKNREWMFTKQCDLTELFGRIY